jgi:hypothetical protein
MAIYADSPGQYEGLAQQQVQNDASNYFRALDSMRANAALQSQLVNAEQDRRMQALNSMLRHKELQDALNQRSFSQSIALRQLASQEAERADQSARGWTNLGLERKRIDLGNPRNLMYAEDRWKDDIEAGVPVSMITTIPPEKMAVAKALEAEVNRQKLAAASQARSYADNLNRLPSLQSSLAKLGSVKKEEELTDLTPDELAQLNKSDTNWFGHSNRTAELTSKVIPNRISKLTDEIDSLSKLRENVMRSMEKYGVDMDPAGRWRPTIGVPTGLPTNVPTYNPGKLYFDRVTGKTVRWDGQAMVPVAK